MAFQTRVNMDLAPPNQKVNEDNAPNPVLNLENAFIHIEGKRHKLVELLKPLTEKSKE
ncbi:hypothetical protein [Rhodopila sp.]|uniref:hypothetical protein n=1 Tax=Rhodopila sp. TaxID=2480087 RepID=UPI003D10FFA0